MLSREDSQVNIQMMANELWIYPRSFISIPGKYINIPPKKCQQFFLFPRRQLSSDLKKLLWIPSIAISSNLSHFASPDTISVDRTKILDCYEPPSVEAEDSVAG